MTVWGAVSGSGYGSMQVGIDMTSSDSTPSYGESVTITAKFYAKSAYSWNDSETFHWSFNGSSGSFTWDNTLDNNTILILTKTYTYTVGTSSKTVSASCNISGTYSGAAPSVSTSYTEPGASGAPNKVSTPTAGATTSTSQVINWTAPGTNGAAITGYEIAYKPSGGGWTYVTLGNVHTYTASGLTPNTSYQYEVRANSSAGYGPWSNALTVSTSVAAPSNPTGALTDGSSPGTPGLKFTWTPGASNGATGITYDVAYNTSNTTVGATVVTGVTSPEVITAAIAASTTYYGWVRVNSTSPSSTGGWVAVGNTTTQANGGQGDLVDRVNAFALQVGEDLSAPTAVIYNSGSPQSIGNAATQIQFNAAYVNTGNTPMWDSVGAPNQLTLHEAGTYLLSAKLVLAASSSWDGIAYGEAEIQIAGAGIEYTTIVPPATMTSSLAIPVTATLFVASGGEVVKLIGIQSLTSGTFNNVQGRLYTSLSCRRLGP